jgi:hypothetical protein
VGADALLLRRGLATAVKETKEARCPLLVSRLDRLSRKLHFITGLMDHRHWMDRGENSLRETLQATCYVGTLFRGDKPVRVTADAVGLDIGAGGEQVSQLFGRDRLHPLVPTFWTLGGERSTLVHGKEHTPTGLMTRGSLFFTESTRPLA